MFFCPLGEAPGVQLVRYLANYAIDFSKPGQAILAANIYFIITRATAV